MPKKTPWCCKAASACTTMSLKKVKSGQAKGFLWHTDQKDERWIPCWCNPETAKNFHAIYITEKDMGVLGNTCTITNQAFTEAGTGDDSIYEENCKCELQS